MNARISEHAARSGNCSHNSASSTRNSLTTAIAAGAIALALAGASADARADIINILDDSSNSTENLGHFTGSLDYTWLGGDSGVLMVSLLNTSDPDNGGFITGFAFNFQTDDPLASAAFAGSSEYTAFLDIAGQGAPPFGEAFLAGAALGGDWTGGGKPSDGIVVGEEGSFQFDITATDAANLTAYSFTQGPYEHNFVVRFRGFDDGGSDKVPAIPEIPAPAGAIALILGGASLMTPRRRRAI